MLVGQGMIATTFSIYQDDPSVLIFASGVANSRETSREAFERESRLLDEQLEMFRGLVVYFGSIFDPTRETSPYALHKQLMQQKVIAHADRYLLFRLPQVVGRNPNPNTLIPFIAERIRGGTPFQVEKDATRILLDAEDMAKLCAHYIADHSLWGQAVTIAPPPAVPVIEIVRELERLMERDGHYEIVSGGQSIEHVSPETVQLGNSLGLPFGKDYYKNVLGKHYGRR